MQAELVFLWYQRARDLGVPPDEATEMFRNWKG
jgi:hypothetical protein